MKICSGMLSATFLVVWALYDITGAVMPGESDARPNQGHRGPLDLHGILSGRNHKPIFQDASVVSAHSHHHKAKKSKKYSFSPRRYTCCKVGEKAGLKRVSCDVGDVIDHDRGQRVGDLTHANSAANQIIDHVMSKRLGRQIQKCTYLYSSYFKKCCHYRARFVKAMDKCKQLKSGRARKQCRKDARNLRVLEEEASELDVEQYGMDYQVEPEVPILLAVRKY